MTTKKERYVMLRYWLLKSQAWNSLSGNARALYIEIARRYNGSNNGRIPYSVREAKQSLHISSDTASRLLDILQDRGFIVCTKRGGFSLKTTKDASEWALTEYDCDHPPAHATKDFMRWQPEGVDIDMLNRQPSHHRKSKTRYPQPYHTVPPAEPHGTPSRTVETKNAENGTPSRTINAQNALSTVPPAEHLQLPGRGCEPGVRDLPSFPPFPEGEPAETKPWSTPTVEEIVPGTLPTKPAARTNGAQPQADVGPEPIATVPSDDPIGSRACAVCEKSAPTRAVSAPDPVPAEQVEIAPQANEMEAALPAEDHSVRHRDQVMRAIEALCPDHTDARRREAVSDAGRYLARWGAQAQGCGWTSTQQAALICQMRGREVTALSPNQASIGNKVIYRFQL
jgi:hypothetical protein